ncbi:molybdopterin molybdenumtransferase MoeA [Heliobacillus mobilis]
MDFFQCIPLQSAKEVITQNLTGAVVPPETVFLLDALGRVAAEDIVAQENLPPFSRSTVDGFALRSADTFGSSESAPSLFSIVGEVSMGEPATIELLPGQAVAIPTGGMLPAGSDAVIMLEQTIQPDAQTLLAVKMVAPGENVVSAGEDVRSGAVLLKEGQRIAPQHIGVLAACGFARVPVRKRVKVSVISTGDELVDIQDIPMAGQIRDVNSYALAAMLTEFGCDVTPMGIVKDSYEQFFTALGQAVATSQLVIISGGSSVGARDYTVKAIDALGAPGVLFHGISIKPGKPTIFGMIGQVPVFGLPGHPVAAMTVCEQLVKLALGNLFGQREASGTVRLTAQLTRNVASAPGRDDFINVRLRRQQGTYKAIPILGKSGLIHLLAQSDGIMHVPADKSGLYDGDPVEVLLIKDTE